MAVQKNPSFTGFLVKFALCLLIMRKIYTIWRNTLSKPKNGLKRVMESMPTRMRLNILDGIVLNDRKIPVERMRNILHELQWVPRSLTSHQTYDLFKALLSVILKNSCKGMWQRARHGYTTVYQNPVNNLRSIRARKKPPKVAEGTKVS